MPDTQFISPLVRQKVEEIVDRCVFEFEMEPSEIVALYEKHADPADVQSGHPRIAAMFELIEELAWPAVASRSTTWEGGSY